MNRSNVASALAADVEGAEIGCDVVIVEDGAAPGADRIARGDRGARVRLRGVENIGAEHAAGCGEPLLAGSTTVKADGSYSWSGTLSDGCAAEPDGNGMSLAVKFVLRY